MPSFILIHPTVWPRQYTNVTDRTDITDRQDMLSSFQYALRDNGKQGSPIGYRYLILALGGFAGLSSRSVSRLCERLCVQVVVRASQCVVRWKRELLRNYNSKIKLIKG